MIELKGKYTNAKVYASIVEKEVIKQIQELIDCPYFEDSQIRIMPDTHAGKGAVIGFTSDVKNVIIPNIVGVDLSCGMSYMKLPKLKIDFNKLDRYIKNNIPSGFKKYSFFKYEKDLKNLDIDFYENLLDSFKLIGKEKDKSLFLNSIGTLGGGNHFIELNEDEENFYVVVHSGSRNFGLQIANYYQDLAFNKFNRKDVPKDLNGLPLSSKEGQDYLFMASNIAHNYAYYSRYFMVKSIVDFLLPNFFLKENLKVTTHNYIENNNDKYMIRKGAISAKLDEEVLIPLNMRDGSLICKGKGNKDWNESAPHGAGRILSRNKAKRELNLEDYKKSMKNVYTNCISKNTLDEAPMAYKNWKVIKEDMKDTVEVIKHIKPIYNFKG